MLNNLARFYWLQGYVSGYQTGNFVARCDILPAHSNFPSAHFCILAGQSPCLNTFHINKVRDFMRAVAQ